MEMELRGERAGEARVRVGVEWSMDPRLDGGDDQSCARDTVAELGPSKLWIAEVDGVPGVCRRGDKGVRDVMGREREPRDGEGERDVDMVVWGRRDDVSGVSESSWAGRQDMGESVASSEAKHAGDDRTTLRTRYKWHDIA